MAAPIRITVEPRPVWFRGLFSGQFSTRGVVIEESRWNGKVEYGVRLENGNFFWAGEDQIKERIVAE